MIAMLVLAAMAASAPARPPAALVASLPQCQGQLTLSFDGEGGNFDGMSQGGTLLVLRNIGPNACRTPALPTLRFADAAHRPLAIVRKAPPGMHPGPVVLPVGIAAGAEATATLHWVSGDVYDGHHCLSPATASVHIGGQDITESFGGRLCGPAGVPVSFSQTWLMTDPVLAAPTAPG